MFRVRLISGIVLVAIALVVLIAGGPLLAVTLLIVSLIGQNELYRALKIEDREKGLSPLAVAGYLACIAYYLLIFFGWQSYAMAAVLGSLILLMMVYVFCYPRYQAEQAAGAFFGFVYVAVMLSCIYELRLLANGVFLVWLIFIASWGCDTCAYCVGMLIGKHKMAPRLSPKKSVEGAVGGVAGATVIGVIYALAVSGRMSGEANYIAFFAVISFVGALISMVGDLAASAIKRNHDIKDFGKLIPGHGGILDRFDSVIFIAPVVYWLSVILSGLF